MNGISISMEWEFPLLLPELMLSCKAYKIASFIKNAVDSRSSFIVVLQSQEEPFAKHLS